MPIVLPDRSYPNQQQVTPQITRHPLFCYRDESEKTEKEIQSLAASTSKKLNGVILCDQSIRYICHGPASVFDFLCVYTYGGKIHNSRYPCYITFVVCLFVYYYVFVFCFLFNFLLLHLLFCGKIYIILMVTNYCR